jgi:rhomboid protease GluP
MMIPVFQRKTTGSVVCPSCGSLVGVRDDKCYMCGRANPGLWGFGPLLRQLGTDMGFVPLVIGACSILYGLTLVASGEGLNLNLGGGGIMSFLSPSGNALLLFGMSGAGPVFGRGEWWTLLSASWLHGGLLHIFFNMYWVRRFGPDMVELIGPSRTVIVYVASGVAGFLLSSTAGLAFASWGVQIPLMGAAAYTMGASASILGMLGAIAHYGRTGGSSLIRAQVKQYLLWFVISGLLFRGTDNWAHLGGFLGGYATSALLNPLTRERGDHLLIAIGCLVATLLAILASVARGLAVF